ncbi:cyanamide hydratase [Fusarium sporotrichioides]|uniref:Cyanamide hydratase n=1 Tax=Fusarium sporotrichioides TaxID=5514 RepID=A0A395SCX3_FUSSP|nr:cyanamide hydratase [Fusarium sporotrichioides]
MSSLEIKANGWTAVPLNAKEILDTVGKLVEGPTYKVEDIQFPSNDKLVAEAQSFAKERLSPEAYNHSMRVFYWGTLCVSKTQKYWLTCQQGNILAKRLLPEHFEALSTSTWALTCLLHDIGTAEVFFTSTHMSFDLYGGIKAMEVLKVLGGTTDQAEAVAEAIIRHQDVGVDGTITFLGQLIQLATLYDNVGVYEGIEDYGSWVDEATRDNINKTFPRHKWTSCFASVIRQEESNKPWCHSTHIVDFPEKLEANTLMKPWE